MNRLCLALAVLALSAPAAFAEVKANSPDGNRTASAKDRTITITDNKTQKALLSIKAHKADVTGLAYSPDGKMIGSVDRDGVLNLFDASIGKVILTIKAGIGGSLSFSPNGKTVAVAGDKKTKKFDVATGKETQ
jgi:hypothetical protein